MSFYVEDAPREFERCPAGMHLARCYSIVDLGTQKNEYMGEVKFLHKIQISWEIHGTDDSGQPLRMNDGRPYGVFKNYTHSWSEKANLRLDLQSWRGKPFSPEEMRKFDLSKVLGQFCMLNIIERQSQNGKVYANINGVTPVPSVIKQAGLPEGVNPTVMFNLKTPDMTVFEGFSDYLKAKITASPEWAKLNLKPVGQEFSDEPVGDDIPFN
jgi:hypothetical protein